MKLVLRRAVVNHSVPSTPLNIEIKRSKKNSFLVRPSLLKV
ncbi:MAG: hypothetical protein ACD_12C00329G0002 [uncultured bacterium]|nr:MAG: hypothetical protein ACD_12C00329G0002 [uncultured bacterium]